MAINFDLTWEPDREELSSLAGGLDRHAVEVIGEDGFRSLAIFVRDTDGSLLAGVSAFLNWNWLQVSLLWVDENVRGEGLGSELLERLESIARKEGCTGAHVSTFSFQATPFYELQGYEIFATLDNYPPGHAKHFLRKTL